MSDNRKKQNAKDSKKYIDLLYMTPETLRAGDIAIILRDIPGFTVELWDEMNILELELANQRCVDFEPLNPSFKDPSDASFIKNRNIKTIFALNLCDLDLDTISLAFHQIIERHSGFLCADSEDFTPVYAGSSRKISG